MSVPSPTTYDDLPYPSQAFVQTHPDRIAALASLFGMTPVPANRCRVLELGCASGGNIVPLAIAYPESTFLGIDLSARQVEEGQKTIAALGLTNVELRAASILDVDASFGDFDYVTCHGVYSWVPAPVQGKILDICAERLRPNGIGYVSYNTFPGWHMRGMIRDMMCIHVSRVRDQSPLAKVGQARTLLEFLAASVQGDKNPYGMMLRNELELLQKCGDSYIYHEHLEENNDPTYFYEFHEQLRTRQLRYLGEADFSVMVPANFSPEVQQILARLAPNQIEMEQYLDFLRNRTFRQTLICHEQIHPNYELSPALLARFHIAASVNAVSAAVDLRPGQSETFAGPNGMTVSTPEPLIKAALACLAEAWPRPLPFAEVRRRARARLDASAAEATVAADDWAVANALLQMFSSFSGLVELWQNPPAFTTEVSAQPLASPLARHQVATGHGVTSLRHQPVNLTEFDRQLLPLLDGTRRREDLLYQMVKRVKKNQLTIARNGVPVTDEKEAREVLAQTIEEQLPKFAKSALLVR